MDVVGLLVTLGGIAEARTLRINTSRRQLRTALGRGEIVRVARGRYALPDADRAVALATDLDAVLTHLTAAAHHGWEIRFPPSRPQLGIPRHRELPDRVDVELCRLPGTTRDGWATGKLETVLMCAADLPFADGLSVADSALRHGDVRRSDLQRAAERMQGERGIRARRVAAYADGRAANPFESTLRALAIEAGLDVVPQYRVETRGLTVHADLADPLRGVLLEAESWEWHGKNRGDFERDCERYTALALADWLVLRFTWSEVMLRPAYVLECLREVAARPCTS